VVLVALIWYVVQCMQVIFCLGECYGCKQDGQFLCYPDRTNLKAGLVDRKIDGIHREKITCYLNFPVHQTNPES
jgi:hypothetical protein